MWIIIEGGDLFEGTLEQFEDCFFCISTSNPREEITDWCSVHKWQVQFKEIN